MLRNLKTGTKVAGGFGIAIVIAFVVGIVGYRGIHQLSGHLTEVGKVRLPSVVGLQNMIAGVYEAAYGERGLIVERYDAKTRADQIQRAETGLTRAEEGRKLYEPLPQTAEESVMWKEFVPAYDGWKAKLQKVLELSRERHALVAGGLSPSDPKIKALDDAAFEANRLSRDARRSVDAKLVDLVNLNVRVGDEAVAQSEKDSATSIIEMFTAIGIGTVSMLALGVLLARSISKVLRALISEATRLSAAAVEGRLQTRGNPELISLEFRPIVEGVNATLDAVIGPLNVAAEYVDRISKGDIPEKITDSYNGDFNEIKNNLNQCIERIQALAAEAGALAEAAVHGKLDTRADASKHQGDFRRIIEGVNNIIDTLVGHLDAVPAPVMIVDRQFSIQYMNTAGTDLLKRSKEQVVGTKCHEHFKTSDCKTDRCACDRAMREARMSSSETDAHPNDLDLEISYAGVPIRDREGHVLGALEVVTDQTVIKRAARVATKVAKYQESEVGRLSAVLDRMAAGDLTHRYALAAADEDTASVSRGFATIAAALNSTIDRLNAMIGQIAESAGQFMEGSRVIAESSQTLAQGAQSQSSSVEEMTASIEELSRSVQMVKENAETANRVAQEANQMAEQGGRAVQKSVESMAQIRTSSTQIAEIIQVISEIASQTNLLALNAAIEAARAGEHGMGFAVVADEVRKLAERSNQAAREISALIKESTQRVEEGAQLSDQTGESLKQIIQAAQDTAARIAEIATVTLQQASNADEVAKAIQGVAQVTEQAAAGSEEMASSSQELGAQATVLRDLVGQFTTTSTTGR